MSSSIVYTLHTQLNHRRRSLSKLSDELLMLVLLFSGVAWKDSKMKQVVPLNNSQFGTGEGCGEEARSGGGSGGGGEEGGGGDAGKTLRE